MEGIHLIRQFIPTRPSSYNVDKHKTYTFIVVQVLCWFMLLRVADSICVCFVCIRTHFCTHRNKDIELDIIKHIAMLVPFTIYKNKKHYKCNKM